MHAAHAAEKQAIKSLQQPMLIFVPELKPDNASELCSVSTLKAARQKWLKIAAWFGHKFSN